MSPASPDRRPLAERWRPSHLRELVGNAAARRELEAWAEGWRGDALPARRAVLLVGPPGVGKTTAAVALAEDRGWALVEMNASEARNQSAIEKVAGRASIARPLDAVGPGGRASRTLILLDEADCLSGRRTTDSPRPERPTVSLRSFLEGRYGTIEALNTAWGLVPNGKPRPFPSWASLPASPGNAAWAKRPSASRDLADWRESGRTEEVGDRGGLGAIARLVRSTRQPLVLTVNDDRPLHRSSAAFRSSVRTIAFAPIGRVEVAGRLRAVAEAEGLVLGPELLGTIVDRAEGDLRAALNDLEALAPLGPGALPRETLLARDRASEFGAFVEELLSTPRFYRATEVRDRLDAPPDDLLPWVEENVPWFAPDDVHRDAAFEVLRSAELMLARARRWRTYGLWSYASELLSGGVSLAIRERPAPAAGRAGFPAFLGAMGYSRSARGVRDALARKLGHRLHLSVRKGRAVALPFAEALFEEVVRDPRSGYAKRVAQGVVRELALAPEEVASLLGRAPDSPEVRELIPTEGAEEDEEAAPGPSASGRPTVQRSLGDWGRAQ